MLFLISLTKSLDYETPPHILAHTKSLFVRQSAALIQEIKTWSPQQISTLMKLSDVLPGLNVARYQAWSNKFTAKNSKPAVLAFNGDVSRELDAKTLSAQQLDLAQAHVCILIGLYGVLQPLDWMQSYRLEMDTALATKRGNNLYQFWGNDFFDYSNARAAVDTSPVVVNLTTEEYFKAVDRKALTVRMLNCVFEDFKGSPTGGKYKTSCLFARRARGLMVRYAVKNQLTSVKKLVGFNAEGYRFDAPSSAPDRLVSKRGQAPQDH